MPSRMTEEMIVLNHLRRRCPKGCRSQAMSQRILKLGDLRHHGQRVLRLLFHLLLKILVLQADALDLVSKLGQLLAVIETIVTRSSLALRAGSLALVAVGWRLNRISWRRSYRVWAGMYSPQMLVEIFLPREALAGVPLAVGVWTVDRLLRPSVLPVDFAFVSQQAAGVGKARQVLAPFY